MFTTDDVYHCDDIAKGKSRDRSSGPSSADLVSGPTFRVGSGAMLQQLLDASCCKIAQLASRDVFAEIVVQFHLWMSLPCSTQWKRFLRYRWTALTLLVCLPLLLVTTFGQWQPWTPTQTFRQPSLHSSDSRRKLRADFMTPQTSSNIINTEVSNPKEMPASGAGPVSGSEPRGSPEVKASGAGPASGSDPRGPAADGDDSGSQQIENAIARTSPEQEALSLTTFRPESWWEM